MNKEILFKLADLIKKRRLSNREDSYVKSLLEDGTKKINEKIFEEALELIEASLEDNEAKKKKVIHEMADLWFHTMVLLENEGLELEDILSELETRFGTSGHEEKSSR
ncbi:MAG: phosphoribosyl-ATP diphosphatase [SAR86 cluster bacterium]|jgi:phosphoribosyl-ATP pyrophosphohydrolase|nr:phosphoribosyl-ATP diphosphatase [SAR86 cluster bacterium]|tara:strand:+ start:244 stop:567 length:324 start_codon:yes stop_codon:yes gene_type:complete